MNELAPILVRQVSIGNVLKGSTLDEGWAMGIVVGAVELVILHGKRSQFVGRYMLEDTYLWQRHLPWVGLGWAWG